LDYTGNALRFLFVALVAVNRVASQPCDHDKYHTNLFEHAPQSAANQTDKQIFCTGGDIFCEFFDISIFGEVCEGVYHEVFESCADVAEKAVGVGEEFLGTEDEVDAVFELLCVELLDTGGDLVDRTG